MKGLLSRHVAFDALPDGVAIFDGETGAILDANEQVCRMHGYDREQLLALQVNDLCATTLDAESERPDRIIQKVPAERARKARWLGRRKDGEHFWVEAHLRRTEIEGEAYVVATLREADGGHDAQATTNDSWSIRRYKAKSSPNLVGATVDGAGRREAERAKRESGHRYRELFEAAQEGIVIQSPERRILDINPIGLEILGYRRDELQEMDWSAFVADSDQRARMQTLLREKGVIRNLAVNLRRKDGTKIVCLVSATARRDADGHLRAYYIIFRDITGRKRQEEQFRLLVEEVKEYAIFMLNPTGHIITWNEGAEAIKGYTEDEILGSHFSTFYTARDVRAGVPETGLKSAAREGQWKDEGWRVCKDGTRFWAHVTITALHGEDGELRGFAKVTRDMTDRRQRERKLRRSEARYRRLFEESQEGIVISTPTGEIIDANSAAEAILGYSREEMRAIKAHEMYVDPEEREKGAQILAENGILRDFEVHLRRKEGAVITCRLSATVRRGPDGEIEAFQTFFRDVTDEKRALQALRDSEERFRALAEKSLVGIALLQERTEQEEGTQEVVYRYVNPAFAHLTGYAREEIINQSPKMIFHPGDWLHVRDALRKRFAGEAQEAHYEARLQTQTGEVRTVEVLGTRFTYQGRPAIIGTVLDVTERRRLEKALLRVQEEERRRIGRELHDGVASELTGAGALTSVVSNKAKNGSLITPEELDQIGTLIKESSREIRKLSRGLSPTELDAGLVPALKGLVRRSGARGELTCAFEAVGEAPDLPEEIATHLYRIAQEAVQNAVRHAEAQRIRVRYGLDDAFLILEIRDDGCGGAEGTLFEEKGLGMRTMRYRANLIGGTLTIEEAPEGGTIVRCRLPARQFQSSGTSVE